MGCETGANFNFMLAHKSILLLIIDLIECWENLEKEDGCRLDSFVLLTDILTFYSVVVLTWQSPSFMKPFLLVGNNVSCELQKTRLQNMKFLQEANCSLMLFLDTMSVFETVLNLQGILLLMFSQFVYFFYTCIFCPI